jgi:hypothetical protein
MKHSQVQLMVHFDWRKTSSALKTGTLLHYVPQGGRYVYFRHDGRQTVMVVLNKGASGGALDLARFKAMIKGAARGRNVITGETVDLQAPLALKAMTSVAIEW